MNRRCRALADVLSETRLLLSRVDNDFTWSSWRDGNKALQEMDGLIAKLKAGEIPPMSRMSILFAPTGPIQEVSVSSGWGDEFLHVAARFDAACNM